MNYKRIYNELITNRQNNPLPKETYTEKHHIIPKSHGGSNDKDNLVALSAREHFIAHWLLWRIHRDKSMSNAFYSFKMDRYGNRYINSYGFEEARKAKSAIMSNTQLGEHNHMYGRTGDKHHMYGKKWSEDSKEALSIKASNRSSETLIRMRESQLGKKASKETKDKLKAMRAGEGNCMFDSCLYHFINKNGTHEICTRYNLYSKYNFDRSKIGLLLRGDRNSVYGWMVSKEAMPLSYKPIIL